MTQDFIDQAIDRSLLRDAEAMPKFATVPNERLTAKLAMSVATKGVMRSLTNKLLLLGAGVLVTIAAIYLIPSRENHPVAPARPAPIVSPQVATPAANKTADHSPAPISNTNEKTNAVVSHQSPKKLMRLDEGDGKNIPVSVDPLYQPPLKNSR